MLLHFNALAIDSWSSLRLPVRTAVPFASPTSLFWWGRVTYNSFYGPDSQNGKGQYVKNCNLAQVEYAVKMDIKIEWNCDYNH